MWKSARLFRSTIQSRNGSSVGFIGLGQMGSRMIKNLVTKGQQVKVFDVTPEAVGSVQGVTICKSAKDAVTDVPYVITMLPNGAIVKDLLTGQDGILGSITENALHIDCSTIEPGQAKDLYEICKNNNIRFIDAPVSGGYKGAEAGTLTFMAGGHDADVQEVEPLLLKMGSRVIKCGSHGSGQVAKICNNLILGITMIGTSEALNLGAKLGLDPKILSSIINSSTGRSWTSETYNPVPGILENTPASGSYKGGFSSALIAKDLGIAATSAIQSGAALPLGAVAHQLYRAMVTQDYGNKDFSAVYQFLQGNKNI